jgi:DNA-3-methyladenine glycosylase I
MNLPVVRCSWARSDLSIRYHDEEWGVPCHDDRTLFEFLVLEGAQAGLNWEIVLRKRQNYRAAFDGFDPHRIAVYNRPKIRALMRDPGIIRNQRKILSAVENAKAFLKVQQEFGSFDRYIWRFVGGEPRVNAWRSAKDLPTSTRESDAMSKDLRKREFAFVGSTICYAFMQAMGLVNDHVAGCFRGPAIAQMNRRQYK